MTKFNAYRLVTDSGIAPCEYAALLSLAICKPAIRRTAKVGDYIVGLSSKSIHRTDDYPLDSIIYVAKIGSKLRGEDYYPRDGQADISEYRDRLDRIYSRNEASRRYSMIPNGTGHTKANVSWDIGLGESTCHFAFHFLSHSSKAIFPWRPTRSLQTVKVQCYGTPWALRAGVAPH